jgi:hypothetical protein
MLHLVLKFVPVMFAGAFIASYFEKKFARLLVFFRKKPVVK